MTETELCIHGNGKGLCDLCHELGDNQTQGDDHDTTTSNES